MIISRIIEVGLCPRNVKYYEEKGYVIPRKKDSKGRINYTKGSKIEVKIQDLMPTCKAKVLVKCEICSKERFVSYDTLVSRENSQFLITGETLCVKCSNKKFSNEKRIHKDGRYPEYRSNAKKRGISFDITSEEFFEIVSQKCHYCGGYSKDRNISSRGNGIDRKDSSIGYIYDNCVPCCATCNFVKNAMPYDEFIKYIRALYERTKNYEI